MLVFVLIPREMPVDHILGGAPLGMAIGLDQVTRNNQPRTVRYKRMPDETEHRAGAGGLPLEPGVRIGNR